MQIVDAYIGKNKAKATNRISLSSSDKLFISSILDRIYHKITPSNLKRETSNDFSS